MELFTRSKDPSWNRIVHIRVHRCKGIPEFINDRPTVYGRRISEHCGTIREKQGIKYLRLQILVSNR